MQYSHPLSFFFDDPATTEIYTLSLHDALPILAGQPRPGRETPRQVELVLLVRSHPREILPSPAHDDVAGGADRKSTRLNSSHQIISYAVFCLKKKKKPN